MAAAAVVQEVAAKDAIINWFKGEFAAANAIIDALCGHLSQVGCAGEYDGVFAAVHRRRLNWIPVLHMQKYYSVADVAAELRRVAAARSLIPVCSVAAADVAKEENCCSGGCNEGCGEPPEAAAAATVMGKVERSVDEECVEEIVVEVEMEKESSEGNSSRDSSTDLKVLEETTTVDDDAGSRGEQGSEYFQICTDHENCATRPDMIKISKGFVAKEPVKGHMVNVVKGLKLYEDVFTDSELSRLAKYINELRQAGRRGELSGDTFIFFNKEMKGNKREIIQLGAPLFHQTKEGSKGNNEPIPEVLQNVIEHLVQWRLIPEGRKPNSCIINFFDEDEHSQPYQKPPHLDNPITTLLLSDTTMAFGRMLASDNNNNYKGSLSLNLKEGSLLVLRGNSADMARHVICASLNRRVVISFVKVRPANNVVEHPASPVTKAITLWQPGATLPQKMQERPVGYGPHTVVPTWGVALRPPVVMLAPRPMLMSPSRKDSRNGTGVFLPWTVAPKKYTRHLPPRIQRRRLTPLAPAIEA